MPKHWVVIRDVATVTQDVWESFFKMIKTILLTSIKIRIFTDVNRIV